MRVVVLLLAFCASALADDLAPVRAWIAQQRSIKTIEADFTQTRALRTLRSPAVAHGKFWFRAPASFRWQIGDPPKMIALGDASHILTVQPAKHSAERTATDRLGETARGRGFDFLKFPFAADFDDFQHQFEVLSVRTNAGSCHLEILPRDPSARRALTRIVLDFNVASGKLLGFEIVTREGSSLRTEFANTRVNAPLDPAVFGLDLTGYQIRDAK